MKIIAILFSFMFIFSVNGDLVVIGEVDLDIDMASNTTTWDPLTGSVLRYGSDLSSQHLEVGICQKYLGTIQNYSSSLFSAVGADKNYQKMGLNKLVRFSCFKLSWFYATVR